MRTILCLATAGLTLAAGASAPAATQIRMTPIEVMGGGDKGDNQVGSSKLPGVHTRTLVGDPTTPGFYSILLFVPAHTTIQAHSHRDDRMATVVSGRWQFGYGTRFNEAELKTLPPGSVYSEPGGVDHFARTADEPVVVHICGVGPTDTRYFEPANDPALKGKDPH
jgi:quercetin dioxygenase-like cupin family protein